MGTVKFSSSPHDTPWTQSGVRARPRLSTKQRNILIAAGIVLFTVSTLLAVPTSQKPQANISIPLPYKSVGPDFASIDHSKVIPNNILEASVVPRNAQLIARDNFDQGNGTFDRAVIYASQYGKAKLITFETLSLKHFGWTVLQSTIHGTVTTLYARKAGNDGNFWEMGLTVSPTKVVTLSPSPTQTRSSIEVRLLLVNYS